MAGQKLEIQIDANVTGSDDVGKLGTDLNALGRSAKDAGTQAQNGAIGLDQVGETAKLMGADAQVGAAGLAELTAKTLDAKSADEAARAALLAAKNAVEEKRDAIAKLRDGTKESERGADGYTQALTKLKAELYEAKSQVRDFKVEQANTTKAFKDAKTAQAELEASQKAVGASTRALGGTAKELSASQDKATTALNDTARAADKTPASYSKTRQGLESISTQLDVARKGLADMAAQLAAGFSFQQFVQAAAQMEQLQAGLQAVSGDAALAKEQMDFVRQMATRAGVDVTAAGSAFLGLAAATKGTAVEGEPARQVFEAVTVAMAKAGKSSAETQNALLALSQMASKGTVSMEELRGQLGEALPGALQAAANGLGITTQDLIKLVESGQIAAEDLFPALAKGLNDLYGSAPGAQTLSQEITNVKNAFVEMAANIGEAGALDGLKAGAEAAQAAIVLLGDTLLVTGQSIGTLAAAVTSLDFSGIPGAMAEIEAASRDRLLKAAEHNDVLRAALKLSSDQAVQTGIYVAEMGAKAEQAGAQAAAAAPGYTALGAAYAKVRDELKGQLELADKEVQSIKAKGEAAVAQAKLLGDEGALRAAVSKAAADEAAAMESLAQKRQTEVNVLVAELENKRALLAQGGAVTEAKQKELKALEDLIAAKQVDADKTLAQAAASRAKAQAVSEEVQTTQAAVQSAEALKTVRVADAQVLLSGLQAQKELARQTEEMARLMGNEAQARGAKILQLEIEIKITQAKTAVAKVEAEGTIAVAQAKLAELKASGQLTPVKQAEIEASIKLAQAKVVEAEAMGKSTALLQKQIDALRSGTAQMGGYGHATTAATVAVNAQADAIERLNMKYLQSSQYSERQLALLDKEITAREKAIQLAERAQALEDKRLGRNADKQSVDRNGNPIQSLNGYNERYVLNDAKSAGLSEAGALKLFDELKSQATGLINPASLPAYYKRLGEEVAREARQRSGLGQNLGVSDPLSARYGSGSAAANAPAVVKTYNVVINGTTVRTASDADAQALIAVLQNAKLAA